MATRASTRKDPKTSPAKAEPPADKSAAPKTATTDLISPRAKKTNQPDERPSRRTGVPPISKAKAQEPAPAPAQTPSKQPAPPPPAPAAQPPKPETVSLI